MDNVRYAAYQNDKLNDFEAKCKCCGRCCGAEDGDPCENLVRNFGTSYYCKIYDLRLGLQKTVSGKIFSCVSIGELIRRGSLREACAYKKIYG